MGMIGYLVRVTNEELGSFLNNPALVEAFLYNANSTIVCDLDKSWEAANFVFTGSGLITLDEMVEPLKYLMFSNQVFDEEQDLGYGPAHYVLPEQVKEVNIALCAINDETLGSNYDTEKMNELGIYPGVWD